MRKKTIALIQGGPGPEQKVSLISALAVAKALDQLNYNYFIAPVDSQLPELLRAKKPDLAFLAVHGLYGEDGLIPALCEFLKIPYTGSGVLASSFCMDKIVFKQFLKAHKIPSPNFYVVDSFFKPKALSYPVVVKSSHGGSSIGTFLVKKQEALLPAIKKAQSIGAKVFIEDYIPSAQEIAVSYLDGKILTPVEIKPKGEFYDYKRKYVKGESDYFVPPRIDPFVLERVKSIAEHIFRLSSVRSYARADFLIEKSKTPWLIELNTLPGLTENSLLPKSAQYDGISFTQLVKTILQLASTDYKIKKS